MLVVLFLIFFISFWLWKKIYVERAILFSELLSFTDSLVSPHRMSNNENENWFYFTGSPNMESTICGFMFNDKIIADSELFNL